MVTVTETHFPALLGRLITASEPQTVGQIADCCGVHLSGVSRHLSMLRDVGVVSAQRRGREVLYSLECEPFTRALRQLADTIEACHRACCGTGSSCCPAPAKPKESTEHDDEH